MRRAQNDEERCKAGASTPDGVCPNAATVISAPDDDNIVRGKYCEAHGGAKEAKKAQKTRQFEYNLMCWQNRVSDFAVSPTIKSIRQELGVLRLLLEQRMQACRTSVELLTFTGPVRELVEQIRKTVETCERIEKSQNQLLDKSQIIYLAQQVLEVLVRNMESLDATPEDKAEFLETVSHDIVKLVEAEDDEASCAS